MKKTFKIIIILLLFTFSFYFSPLMAQVPQAFNYQTVARDASGTPRSLEAVK